MSKYPYKVLRMKPTASGTLPVFEVPCVECGAPLERSYQAVMTATNKGIGCACPQCVAYRRHRKLNPYLERLIDSHATSHEERTGMRALLSVVDPDEPVKIRDADFWKMLAERWADRPGKKRKTATNYMHRAKQAMGLSQSRRRGASK